MTDHHILANFIWQIADLLRGPYRPPQYERVILPMTVLRRFDCVLAPTKAKVLAEHERLSERFQGDTLDRMLNKAAGQQFHNHSILDFTALKVYLPEQINKRLQEYINGFSRNVQNIFSRFDFTVEIERMHEASILYLVVSKFCEIDLHPNTLDNIHMGLLFEDLIRRFNEAANETAGDHFTPREVIRLMVDILFKPDDHILSTSDKDFKLLDPTCGTGGMLSEAKKHLRGLYLDDKLSVYGQDFNPRSYAIAAADTLMRGYEDSAIRFGDSLVDDQFIEEQFDYFLANPPFGVDWKRQQKFVQDEQQKQGWDGRFGAGVPRVNDGSLLFLQHMIHKFVPYSPEAKQFGSRLAIVFNGSPLFTGGPGSGESNIRKWIIERDWLEAIVALPTDMFYNTGINTYIWIVTNRKQNHRRGKIQLIDARDKEFYISLRRNLGEKRRKIGDKDEGEPDQIGKIVDLYKLFQENQYSKIFENTDFGYQSIPIERPLRLVYQMNTERKSRFLDAVPHLLEDVQAIDREGGREPRADWYACDEFIERLLLGRGRRWKVAERKLFREVFTERDSQAAPVIRERKRGASAFDSRVWGWFPAVKAGWMQCYEPDTALRDHESVPLIQAELEEQSQAQKLNERAIIEHFYEQIEQNLPDAWADRLGRRNAYEINFNRHFFSYIPSRTLVEIDADLKQAEEDFLRLLREVIG